MVLQRAGAKFGMRGDRKAKRRTRNQRRNNMEKLAVTEERRKRTHGKPGFAWKYKNQWCFKTHGESRTNVFDQTLKERKQLKNVINPDLMLEEKGWKHVIYESINKITDHMNLSSLK